jgi:apolipoprotein N-acyltransferase
MRSIPLRCWALVVVAVIAQLISFPIAGPAPLWRRIFCWFCLAPLLYVLLQCDRSGKPLRAAQTALLGYLFGVLWYAGNCYWIFQTMHIYGGLSEPVSLGILFLFALYLGLYPALFGWILGRLHLTHTSKTVLCISPFVWVALELARARVTGFPWDLLGYTQVDNSVLTSLAPLGGVMMLSFLIAAVSALFAAAFLAAESRSGWKLVTGTTLFAAALQAGTLYQPSEDPANHLASLLQENLAVGAGMRELAPISEEEKYREFTELSRYPCLPASKGTPSDIYWIPVDIAPRTSNLIVWPEAPADFATSDPEFRSQLSDLAISTHAPVIAGSIGVDFNPAEERGYHEFGSAAVFNWDGSYLGRYDKIHRVPWGEYVPYKKLFFFAGNLISGVGNMEAGRQHTIFQLNGHGVGIFICYESIFGDEVREFARDGAQVLVNISDDGWYGDSGAPWQHLDMARMRAIENRRWILRDTNTGVTTSIDPHGRGVFTTPRHVRAAFAFPFDYRSDTTFYTRHGDWFAWICAIVTTSLLAIGVFRPRSSEAK